MISSIRSPASRVFSRSVIIASSPTREPDEHVEVLGALAPRGGGQQPAVRDRAEPHELQRLVGVGGRVGVAQCLVGDQQMPRDHLQVGGVAVEHAVGDEHHARAIAERGVERADLRGDRPALVDEQHLHVGRERRQPAAGRAAGELVAPLPQQPALGDDDRSQPAGRGRLGCASARPLVTVFPVPTWLASTPEPTTFSAAISCWRPSSTGSSASGRASVIRTTCRAPASSVTFAPAGLSARSSLIACSATTRRVVADRPSEVVIVSAPGRPFIRPTRTLSFRCPAASVESSSGRPRSTAVWTASPRSITALGWP